MTAISSVISPVQLRAEDRPDQPPVTPGLVELYKGFEKALLVPLWTEIGDLMPLSPKTKAQPHRWEWKALLELAGHAGELVPIGRGGERRAIALANPGLGGKPLCRATTRSMALSWFFLCSSGRSPVLVDQAVDDLPARNPASHVDHLAGFV